MALTAAVAASPFCAPVAAGPPSYLGPVDLAASADGRTLFVACADRRQVLAVDVSSRRVTARLDLPGRPSGLALAPDGKLLFVTCASPDGVVAAVDPHGMRLAGRLPAGHGATAPVAAGSECMLVCNRFDHAIAAIDRETGKLLGSARAVREPVAAARTPDGRFLVVANHLPAGRADGFFIAASVSIVRTHTLQARHVTLPNGSTGLRGAAVSPDGRLAFVTHILGNYELVPSHVSGGWTNINALSVIDMRAARVLDTLKLDDQDRGAANPWGVACSGDGRWLCVAHAGTHEVSVIDLARLLARLQGDAQAGATPGGIPDGTSLADGLRRRVALRGHGPRALTIVGQRAYVADYFSDLVEVVDLPEAGLLPDEAIALGPAPRWTEVRRGEALFHDATICYQQFQSCASCHPDARADGLNWDLTNDGVGNPKNTKSMLLAHRTPPAMSGGVRDTAESAVRSGLEHILFAERPEEEARAIDAYLKSLRPEPSPRLKDGRLSDSARRGRELFVSDRLGCARCHPAPLYTDLRSHDMGTRGPYDHVAEFDTPTLVEAWRTAPYLHDGRYATIRELFIQGRHGLSRMTLEGLTPGEIDDLVELVLSL